MVTLFDQQRVTEIYEKALVREARRDERKKALQEGRQEGIRAMIMTLKEFTEDKAVVAQKITKSFGLPLQDAEALVEQHWDE